jgi:putative flippase GtrA
MKASPHIDGFLRRYSKARRAQPFAVKAVTFAVVGLLNTLIDVIVFFGGYTFLTSTAASGALESLTDFCRCGSVANVTLVAANLISWTVASSNSYVVNSYTTFAVESGRQLRMRAYAGFLVSGLVGLVANTSTLVIAAQVLPVWGAKICAILVSFLVNFSLTNFVVFRQRRPTQP